MTSNLDAFNFGCNDTLLAQIRAQDRGLARELLELFTRPLPSGQPFDWAVAELILDTPTIKGQPFNATGREYLRDPINDINADDCREQTCCWGTGNAKTLKNLVQATWAMEHAPFSGLFILPSKEGPGGGRQFNNGSLIPTIERTRCFAAKIPTGADRHNFSGLHLQFAGNNVDLAGANSPTQLGAKRCQFVWLDEQDKYKAKLGREEGADYLAGERTKQVPNAKIIRGSTPTKEDFGIWPHLMRSDLRRRFLPCPHCNPTAGESSRFFVLIKDDQFSVMPTKFADGTVIPAAQMRWDKEAKRQDGTWDIDRVIRSTRFECPHCQGHIQDHHRIWMDKNGVWMPTRLSIGHKGYHLPSFYAPHIDTETSWGHMAKKFLDKQESGELQGYINSDLAEVHVSQEHADRSIIEITSAGPDAVSSVTWWPELSGDRQARYPGFWYRVRRWCLSILRPVRTPEQEAEFFKQLTGEQKTALETLRGETKSDSLYAPDKIVAQLTRTDHWPKLADWLIANSLTGMRLTDFFQVEFQTDLIRLLEYIAKQPAVNIPLGRAGDSEAIEIGSADSWEEIDDAQRRHHIANPDMKMDARFGSMDNAEVFAECFRRCPPQGFCHYSPIITPFGPRGRFSRTPMPGYRPFAEWGWTPVLGYPEHKVWPGKDKIRLPYTQEVNDPFVGKMEARQYYQYVFKFDAQWALSEMARVRKKYAFTIAPNCEFHGHNSEQRPVGREEYNLHLRGYFWDDRQQCWQAPGKQGGSQSRRHPNHLYDCEKNGVAHAVWKGIFRYQKETISSEKP